MTVSVLLYSCTTWMLTIHIEKMLNGNCTRMLQAILNKSWKKQLYSNLQSISKTIQLRQTGHYFVRCILTSFSVDETILPRYMNLSTNFRGLPFRVEMAPSRLKHIYYILFGWMWRPMPPAACSKLGSKDSAWVGGFARSARSSA